VAPGKDAAMLSFKKMTHGFLRDALLENTYDFTENYSLNCYIINSTMLKMYRQKVKGKQYNKMLTLITS
jgi:hypothetical protein